MNKTKKQHKIKLYIYIIYTYNYRRRKETRKKRENYYDVRHSLVWKRIEEEEKIRNSRRISINVDRCVGEKKRK
jgi:hypothetical protein